MIDLFAFLIILLEPELTPGDINSDSVYKEWYFQLACHQPPVRASLSAQCHKSVILHSPDYFTPHFLEVSHSQHITNFPGKRLNSAKNFGKIAFKWDGGWLYLGWNEIKMFPLAHCETPSTERRRPHCRWSQVSSHDGQYAVFWSAAEQSSVETIKLRSSWAINSVHNGDSLQNYRHTSQINILFSICVGMLIVEWKEPV